MPPIPLITWPGLLTTAGALACIATLAGFAGQLLWGFELASHFRVQYAAALGLGALLALVWRRARWAAVFAGFALLNAALVAPAFWEDEPTAPTVRESQPILRALLANVNAEKNPFIRAMPLFMKAPFMRFMFMLQGDRYNSTTLSNLGEVVLPGAMDLLTVPDYPTEVLVDGELKFAAIEQRSHTLLHF